MARRRLLTPLQWQSMLGIPHDERILVQHYTLSRDELDLVASKRLPQNRLGYAVQLCIARHPGRIPSPGETLPDAFLAYVAGQVDARPEDLPAYHHRPQTRREHLADITTAFGYHGFERRMFRDIARWLLSIAQVTRDPVPLAGILIEELRRRRVLLPSPALMELILHQARSRAEHLIHRILLEGLQPDDLARLDTLLAPVGDGETTLLAWLRQAPLPETNYAAIAKAPAALTGCVRQGRGPMVTACDTFHRYRSALTGAGSDGVSSRRPQSASTGH